MEHSKVYRLIAYSILYFLFASYGSEFYLHPLTSASMTPLWPASGVFLAALVCTPYRQWTYYIIILGLIQFQQEMLYPLVVPVAAIVSSLSLIIEAILSAFLLRKLFNGQFSFEKVTHVFAFITVSFFVVIITALPAIITNTVIYHESFIAAMLNWCSGSILGILILCPFLVSSEKLIPLISKIPKIHIVEFTLIALITILITYFVFQSVSSINTLLPPFAYLIIPFLVFGAFRFGVAGSSTIALLFSAAALYGTFDSILGSSDISEVYKSIPSISLFLFVSVTISLILTAAVSERKKAVKELERIAHYDKLTNLPNRVLLASHLSEAMAKCHFRQRSLVVVLMDLDGFKAINDNYGHDVGDDLLVKLSKRMQESLIKGDMLARIGGDEFIAVMTDLGSFEDSKPALRRLLKVAADPVTLGDAVVQVSVSIGVTLYPQDGVDADHLIRHADQAMHVAKQTGKNGFHLFNIAQNSASQMRRRIIGDIGNALERSEFFIHYQPKVNMRSGEVIGVEALIRWQHPERGLVAPLDFLPAIEGHSVSLKVGEWVISKALSQIIQWRSMGLKLPISVNISAYQLQQVDFTTCLANLLVVYPEVSPQYLELEILETSALENTQEVSETMKACHQLGVHFALDDFGTGYSSLTYLKRLPARTIKIDQSFVRDMLEDKDDLAIVEGVVGLAKAFGRNVIAEGVETVPHGVALLQLGCELAQGYGIARPMPGDDIPEWISQWKADDSWQVSAVTT